MSSSYDIMREYLEKANRLNTACLGISAAILLPSLAVWGISLFRVRKQGDPVRSGTRWIKAVWSIWLIALILDVSTRAITTYLSYGSGLGSILFDSQDSSAENLAALAEMRRVMDLTKAGNHLGNVSTLFGYFADVALFGTFLALAWGLLTAVDGFTRPGSRYTSKTWLVWVPFAASALVLLGVSLAHFGLYTDYVGKYLEQRDLVLVVDDGSDDSERDFRIFELGTEMRDLSKAMNKVSGAAACVYFAFFTGMVGYVFYYPVTRTRNQMCHGSAWLLFAAAFTQFVRKLYLVVYAAMHVLPRQRASTAAKLEVSTVVSHVFDVVLMYVVLALLFVIGIRKARNGLWSTVAGGSKVAV